VRKGFAVSQSCVRAGAFVALQAMFSNEHRRSPGWRLLLMFNSSCHGSLKSGCQLVSLGVKKMKVLARCKQSRPSCVSSSDGAQVDEQM
jgi:hypothetical protein